MFDPNEPKDVFEWITDGSAEKELAKKGKKQYEEQGAIDSVSNDTFEEDGDEW